MYVPKKGGMVKLGNEITRVVEIKMIDFKKHYVLQTRRGTIITVPRDRVSWDGKQFLVDE